MRPGAAAWVWLVLVVAGSVAGSATGQAADELQARQAHRLVEQWVRAGEVPGQRAEPIRAESLLGVRVTLRIDGAALGQGTALRGDLGRLRAEGAGALRPAADLVPWLETATAGALRQAMEAVRDRQLAARVRAARDPQAPAAGEDITPRELGPQLDVDVQLAHRPERVLITEADGPGALYRRFVPGVQGLLTWPRGEGGEPAAVWPGTAVAQNLAPPRQVLRLLTGAGRGPAEVERLGRPEEPALYRFETLHLVRPRADQPATLLVRGAVPLPARFVDQPTLRGMADRVAQHLFQRFIGEGRVRGGYRPARARYEPALADDRETALAAYALVSYVDRKVRDRNDSQIFDAYVSVAAEAAQRAGQRQLAADTDPDPVAVAFCLLTTLHAPAGRFDPAFADRLTGALLGMIDEAGHLRADADDPDATLPVASTAAVLHALAESYIRRREPELGRSLASALEALWQRTDGRFDINALPWISRVQVGLGSRLVEDGFVTADVVAERNEDLATMLELIERLQVVERPRVGPADVRGGIVVQPGPDGSPPNPTWTTAPLFGFLATVLRDPAIVPERDRRGTLVTASAAARFLGQLMIEPAGTFAIRSPGEALGGIRLSLWDNRLDVAPSAMTLLGLLEMRTSGDALAPPDGAEEEVSAEE
jgi:hypothetical protein